LNHEVTARAIVGNRKANGLDITFTISLSICQSWICIQIWFC